MLTLSRARVWQAGPGWKDAGFWQHLDAVRDWKRSINLQMLQPVQLWNSKPGNPSKHLWLQHADAVVVRVCVQAGSLDYF